MPDVTIYDGVFQISSLVAATVTAFWACNNLLMWEQYYVYLQYLECETDIPKYIYCTETAKYIGHYKYFCYIK